MTSLSESKSTSTPDLATVTLFGNSGCPFARRGMIALDEKGLTDQITNITIPLSGELKAIGGESGLAALPYAAAQWPGQSVEDLVALKASYKADHNASGEVPALRVGDAVVGEADVMSQYLEEAFPESGTPLLPKDALGRSRVRHLIKEINGGNGVSAMYGCLMNQDPAEDAAKRDKLYSGLAKFAELSALCAQDGPYFLGAEFSLADVMLMPMYDQFRFILPHYRGVEFIPAADADGGAAYPWAARMGEWAAAVEGRESFSKFTRGKDRYLSAYKGYAGARGVAAFGV